MPSAAARPCRHPGCGTLVRDGSGRCPAHQKAKQQTDLASRQQYERERGTSAQRGYGARWQKVRAGYLASHPLCVQHKAQGMLKVAQVVDHIIPHKGDMVLFWDPNNWQALCKECHDRKTATEDGGWGRGR